MLSRFESLLAGFTKTQADISMNVGNLDNYMYTTTVYFGSQDQPLELTIDTGTNRVVLLDKSCSEC